MSLKYIIAILSITLFGTLSAALAAKPVCPSVNVLKAGFW